MYGFGGVGLSEVQLSISELSVVEVGGPDKRTSWSDLVGVRQLDANNQTSFDHPLIAFCIPMTLVILAAVMYNA